MHTAPGATVPEQLSFSLKSPVFVPVKEFGEIALITRAPWPVFFTVMPTGGLGAPTSWPEKLTLVGDSRIPAAVGTPVRPTICGLPIALSSRLIVAERFPGAVGLNVTLMMQLPGEPIEGKQVLVWVKSPALAPDMLIELKPTGELPVLVTVTVWEAPAPTDCEAKLRLVAES